MDEFVIHLCDWNLQDRYFQAPADVCKELKRRVLEEGVEKAFDWFTTQVDYDNTGKLPVKYEGVLANHCLDELFLDYGFHPEESVKEWTELDGESLWEKVDGE